jgi:hypothetical protein
MIRASHRTIGPACLASLLSVVLLGCGGTSRPAAPTRGQFVARADRICGVLHSADARLRARSKQLEAQSGAAAFKSAAQLVREDVHVALVALVQLEALPEPPADRTKIARLLDGYREEVADGRTLAAAFDTRNSSEITTETEALKALHSRDGSLAVAYGLRTCGPEAEEKEEEEEQPAG